ncbi:MAG: amino acid racemase [Candidatus Peribacteraceae bacterium]|jgi:aspartate racemase|nr:amino acid racemase [Candidatus Peribacteraceae bacterium]
MKTIGVLGGMGPSASLDFYRMLIEQSDGQTNEGYPHILLSNLPVPDFIEDRSREEEAVQMVEDEARKLEQAGADFLVITCNTMHLHLDRFQNVVSIPFISMIDAVVDCVRGDGFDCVGLLGSPTTICSGLYQEPLKHLGIKVIIPNEGDQSFITHTIFRIIAGKADTHDSLKISMIIDRLRCAGGQGVILGCTELPLLVSEMDLSVPLFKSSEILAKRAFCEAFLRRI